MRQHLHLRLQTAHGQEYNGLAVGITSTILTYYAFGFNTGKSELLPIPQASLDANPRLTSGLWILIDALI
jgi:hypothetical protein